MAKLRSGHALTFDDVLLVPRHSIVHPKDVDVTGRLTRGIELSIPLVSSAMDTVTEAEMAIAIAREGGIGVIHRFLTIADQVEQVARVKRSENLIIDEPYTIRPQASLRQAREILTSRGVTSLLVTT